MLVGRDLLHSHQLSRGRSSGGRFFTRFHVRSTVYRRSFREENTRVLVTRCIHQTILGFSVCPVDIVGCGGVVGLWREWIVLLRVIGGRRDTKKVCTFGFSSRCKPKFQTFHHSGPICLSRVDDTNPPYNNVPLFHHKFTVRSTEWGY